ncbi:MAG: VWA domain-containing protein [Deltaproteobacteria bacterium]|nr:VWA domain-containing protein [Deltaproteobacteria bacterium]
MQLLGLSLLQIAGVFAGVGAVVLGLYFLRVRRREILVPFAPLFEELLMEQQRERLFGRLRWLLSLLFALLFCAALALALGDPRRGGDGDAGRALVVLVDVSASMASRAPGAAPDANPGAPTRLEQAKQKLHALIADLGPGDRMLVATLGERTTARTGLTDDIGALGRAADALEVEQAGARLDAGLELALDVLEAEPHPEVVLIGDGQWTARAELRDALNRAHVRLSAISVGRPTPNVGILSFAARRLPLDRSRTAVSIELAATEGEARQVELSLSDAGHVIYARRLEIPGGTRLRPDLPVLSGADHSLEAELRPVDALGDGLALDNHAYALLPARRRSRVLAVSRGDLYLSAALLLDEVLDVTESTPEEYPARAEERAYDVVIFDDWLPPTAPRVPAIYLHPEGAQGAYAPFEILGELTSPYFSRLDRHAPLLRFTALDDVNIGRALSVRTRPGDHVLGASPEGPLLIEGQREGQPFLAFTFSPRESDLVLRVAWPILLLDAIEGFGEQAHARLSSGRTGTTQQTRLPEGTLEATLIEPDGERLTLPVQDGVVRVVAEQVGIHRLEFPGGTAELAANLGRADETLAEPSAASSLWGEPLDTPSHGQPGLRRELWPMLVVFALLWLLIESFAWHRRWSL